MSTQTKMQSDGQAQRSDDRPRVLLLVNKLGGGGAERDVAILCEHADQSRFAFEVWTLLRDGDLEPIVHKVGIRVHCLGRKRAYDPVFALRASREIAAAGFDLIHVFLPTIAFYAALAKVVWRARAPLIFSELSSRPIKGLKHIIRRWTLGHYDAFGANSPGARDYLVQAGVESDKVRIIPNGHVVARYQALSSDRETLRASLGAKPDETLAIFVGRLIPSKRVCDLLEAVALLRTQQPRLRVAVVGEGPQRDSLEQQAAALGIDSIVRFAGRRLDVPDLLQVADLFVSPSETEGLSNAVMEAAMAGLPIVACNIGGVREIVVDGRGAFLVPCCQPQALAAEIVRVIQDPNEALRRADLSQRFAVNEYSIQRVTQRLYNVYEEVLDA